MKSILIIAVLALGTVAQAEINWSGDIRFRHEMNSREVGNPASYHVQKIQARVAAKAKATDATDVEVRIASGTGRTSTNQTFGKNKNLENYEIRLDRAYFDYHGSGSVENLFHLYGGRIKNTYYLVGGNDLLFDSDLNFDGLAFSTDYEIAPGVRVVFNQGFYWYSSETVKDAHLISPQLGLKGKWDALSVGVQGTYFNFDHMAGQTATTTGGNAVSGGLYATDFRVWDAGIELGYDLGETPLTVYGDYAKNSAVTTLNKAYIAGVKFGKFKEAGDWLFLYDYRMLEQNSFLGAMTDGDSAGGGVDTKCHRVRGGYQWAKGVMTGVNAYLGKQSVSTGEKKYNRFQLDATFYF